MENILDELLTQSIKSVTIGKNGGKEWKDATNIMESGPITAIELNYDYTIDSIRVIYGGKPGRVHGEGNGNKINKFVVPKGHSITSIDAREGGYVDQLTFVTTPNDGVGEAKYSDTFGRNGGQPKYIDASNLPLRWIEGRAGRRVDSLTFHFGYLYEIENIRVDTDIIKKNLNDAKQIVLDTLTYTNDTEQDATQSVTRSSTLSITNRNLLKKSGGTRRKSGDKCVNKVSSTPRLSKF